MDNARYSQICPGNWLAVYKKLSPAIIMDYLLFPIFLMWGYGMDCSDGMSRQRDNSCFVTVSILCISCCTSSSLIPNSTGYLSFPGSANHGMGSRASMGWRVHGSLRTAWFGSVGMVHVGLLHQHGWTLQQEEVQVWRLWKAASPTFDHEMHQTGGIEQCQLNLEITQEQRRR